jgi:putative colanic acid biosysnthesis UDP-glucose lipid carrier transferase
MTQNSGLLRPHASTLGRIFRLCDAAFIVGSQWLATTIVSRPFGAHELAASTLAVLLFQWIAEREGLYLGFRGHPLRSEIMKVVSAWAVVAPTLLVLGFVSKTSTEFSRLSTGTWFLIAPASLSLFRVVLRTALAEIRQHGRNTRTTAIVGMTPLGERLANEITAPWLGLRFVGYYDDRNLERCHSGAAAFGPHAGDLDDLVAAARRGEIDLVYLALPLRAEVRLQSIVEMLADTTATVYMAADFHAFDLLHARWTALGEVPVVSIHETPFNGIDGWMKRVEDLIVGALIVLMISVPMAIVALAVKLSSPGPVFFRQRRYGLNGEVIHVLKFRSMTVAEDGATVTQATKNDQRITRVGAFIRRTSLDELPQFLQVLTGEMSIVGPRPHAIAHNEIYRKQIRGYMLRHKVKPGITGWAQVNGWRGETDTLEKMEKRVAHDLEYIKNWNLLWDLEIILRTVFSSAARKNAY